jgi:hypothetical protein
MSGDWQGTLWTLLVTFCVVKLFYNGCRVFSGGLSGQGVVLTTHPLLVPRSRKSRAIPLPPFWALWSVKGYLYLYLLYCNHQVHRDFLTTHYFLAVRLPSQVPSSAPCFGTPQPLTCTYIKHQAAPVDRRGGLHILRSVFVCQLANWGQIAGCYCMLAASRGSSAHLHSTH